MEKNMSNRPKSGSSSLSAGELSNKPEVRKEGHVRIELSNLERLILDLEKQTELLMDATTFVRVTPPNEQCGDEKKTNPIRSDLAAAIAAANERIVDVTMRISYVGETLDI